VGEVDRIRFHDGSLEFGDKVDHIRAPNVELFLFELVLMDLFLQLLIFFSQLLVFLLPFLEFELLFV
jgi:hypothetical protein